MFHFESCSQCYPQIIHFNRVFHCKPSILGYPHFWKHPNNQNFGHQKQLNPRYSSTHFVASSTAIPVGGSYQPPSNATTHNPPLRSIARVPYAQHGVPQNLTFLRKDWLKDLNLSSEKNIKWRGFFLAQNASKLGFVGWLLGKSNAVVKNGDLSPSSPNPSMGRFFNW